MASYSQLLPDSTAGQMLQCTGLIQQAKSRIIEYMVLLAQWKEKKSNEALHAGLSKPEAQARRQGPYRKVTIIAKAVVLRTCSNLSYNSKIVAFNDSSCIGKLILTNGDPFQGISRYRALRRLLWDCAICPKLH